MILLIDNYDSFTYNLFQLIGGINPNIQVVRNDQITVQDIEKLSPSHIILSPGPGYPAQAGICEVVIRSFAEKIPILGICLGHQAICEVYGATIGHAKRLMHGKQGTIQLDRDCCLFHGLPEKIKAARYHSLAARQDTLSEELEVTAVDEIGEIMAVQHRKFAVYGLQFHPESIMTPQGKAILENFLGNETGERAD